MKKYRHVLVATDAESGSGSVCERAIDIASTFDARVSLLRVLGHLPQDVPVEPVPPEGANKIEWFTNNALEDLRALAERHGLPASAASVVVSPDSTDAEIIRFASDHAADLVVVGARERHGLALFHGTTTDSLVHNAACDVLVVHI